MFFGIAGCPACAPIAIGVGAAAGIVAGPVIAFAVVAFVVGWVFLAIAAYYLYRVLSGAVVTSLPGEPGGGLP